MALRSLRVGWFLMSRYIRRGNAWASLLIVAIMFLTFLNVVVVRGVLVGLPIGASISYQKEYAGDVIVTPKSDARHIERSTYIERLLPTVRDFKALSARYLSSGIVRADYARLHKADELPDQVGTMLVGIDPEDEDSVTLLSTLVVEGRYLTPDDTKGILLGSQLLERYAGGVPESGGTPETSGTLSNVVVGDTVRVTIDGIPGEYTVLGVVEGKVGENSRRVFMLDRQLRKVLDRDLDDKDEIAVALGPSHDSVRFVETLTAAGVGELATVQTAKASQGKFLDDITATFDLLGNGVALVGIIVAAITVFIMIFIVALNRQKQIGILKGIGIDRLAIESSYVFLSVVYSLIGISLGVLVLYGVVAPYVNANPIDFPFADGILVAPWDDTFLRSIVLIATTILAGYLPARMIVQKHTINAILGR